MPKILVIDDKQDNLISVRALLQNLIPDCRVFTARSGKEGLAIAEKEQPDTILLDIIMPEMDGYQVCEELKANESTGHIPVIMLTAIKSDTASRIKGLEVGADAFFTKPIEPTELSAQINVMLRIKKAEDRLRTEKEKLEKTVWERTKNFIKSENKYRSLIEEALDASVVGVIISDADFKIVWINRALEEYFGLKREKVIGQNARRLIRSTVKKIFENPREFEQRVLASYDDNSYEEHFECHVLSRGDRKERWLEHWSRPINKGLYRGGRIEHYSDITGRKSAEIASQRAREALRESEQKFRSIFEGAADGIIYVDKRLRILEVNPAFTEITGIPAEEVIGKSGFELAKTFVDLKQMPKISEILKNMIANKPIKSYELQYRGKILEITARTGLKNNQSVGIIRDITERKKAVDALLIEKRFSENLLETANVFILSLDLKGNITLFNRFAEKLTGYKKEEVLQKNWFDLFVPARIDSTMSSTFLTVLKQAPEMSDYENPIVCKDGSERLIKWRNSKLKDENGALLGVLSVGLDITESKRTEEKIKTKSAELEEQLAKSEKQRIASMILYRDLNEAIKKLKKEVAERRRAEKELRESEKKFRNLIENSFDGILINNKEGRYLYANSRAAEISGYSIEELLKLNVKDLTPVSNIARVRKRIAERFSGELKSDYFETRILCKDGRETPIEVTADLIVWQGEHAEIITMRDISERRQLEQQLLQAQKMETVGTLAGGVAHDFNNLLTVIQGNAQILQMEMGADSPHSHGLKQIVNAATKAANLTRQLLLFSRKQAMEFKPVDLNELLTNLLKMLRRLLGEDIEIMTRLQPELRCVKADEGNLEQVIMNICINARDAMPDGGRLTITTENIRLSEKDCQRIPESETGDFVRLMIEDTGTGIPQDQIGKIFEPFFTTKEAGKGTGLGLSVVYGIVKKHKGWINVYSEVGHGTIFKIYLPAGSGKAVRGADEKLSVNGFFGNGERILIIEDNEDVRNLASAALRQHGYVTFDAADPGEARRIFKQEDGNFDLILSDVVLPEVNGLELVRELLSGDRDIPVILCSGYTKERVRQAKINDREVGFLQKPYQVQELLKMIKETIAGAGTAG